MAAVSSDPLFMPFPALTRGRVETMQVNLGYRCNQACNHCHVDAGPQRNEQMSVATVELVLDYVRRHQPRTVDITGGAPELNPQFRYLVESVRALGIEVIDRCNLTILLEPGQETLAQFLCDARVHIIASLPCYGVDNVDAQRGKGVFEKSIVGLKCLNAMGFGAPNSGLMLDLVYNPNGPFLPPSQPALEATYKTRLFDDYGVTFNHLFTLANMPIARFRHALEREQRFADYMRLLRENFAAANLENVMCRSLLSVDWRGYVYDCDFNQMLGLPLRGARRPTHLRNVLNSELVGLPVGVGEHCYGCTAGQGSSCGGALNG